MPAWAEVETPDPAAAEVSVEKTFRDWQVRCRDNGFCTASHAHPSGAVLALSREPVPDGESIAALDYPWALEITLSDPPAKGEEVGLALDEGPPRRLEIPFGMAPFGAPTRLFLTDELALMTLLPEIARAGSLSFWSADYIAADAGVPGDALRFSLSGLSASLLFIDEHQGRLGSPRRMDMPAWLPRFGIVTEEAIDSAMREAAAKAHAASGECMASPSRQEAGPPAPYEQYRLSDDAALFLFECNLYAYNSDARAYVTERFGEVIEVRSVAVVTDPERLMATTLIPGAGFDIHRMRLSGYHKGRGMGDIGSGYVWRWLGGATFMLVEHYSRTWEEMERSAEPAGLDWPLVYRYGLSSSEVKAMAARK